MAKFSVPKITYRRKGEEQGWIYESTNPPTYDEMLGKIAGMSYESPIDIVMGEVQFKFEQDVMKAIQSYGICVDRDELIKALQYDRHQYEKGFNDACKLNTKGEWISNCQTDEFICSLCGAIAPVDCEKERFYKSNFCPNCGAKMKGGEE